MKKILALDDNEDILEMLQLILGKKYEVHCITEPDRFEPLMHTLQPDLVIIDHFIGNYTSGSVVEDIGRNNSRRTFPFILFSGSHDVEKKAAELGAAGFITKPSSIGYIRDYIDQFFNPA
ncbi:response regulator [Ferruginibacter sp.]